MKNRVVRLSVLTLFVFGSVRGMAQRHRPQLPSNVLMADSMVSGKFSLIFASNYEGFDSLTRQNMINVFFTVYPEEVERFNKRSLTRIVFFIDTASNAPPATPAEIPPFQPAHSQT